MVNDWLTSGETLLSEGFILADTCDLAGQPAKLVFGLIRNIVTLGYRLGDRTHLEEFFSRRASKVS